MNDMEDAVLLLAFLGVAAYGLLLMWRLDGFREKGHLATTERLPQKNALLFGEAERVNRMRMRCQESGLSCECIEEPTVRPYSSYRIICACSQDDLENLLFCSRARKLVPDAAVIAICNDRLYERLYREFGAVYLLPRQAADVEILHCMERVG